MPAPPKFGNAFGFIRIAEIFRKRKSKHLAKSDRHIRIAGKIKINLQRKSRAPNPCRSRGQAAGIPCGNFIPDGTDLVGNQHFFAHPGAKPQDAAEK